MRQWLAEILTEICLRMRASPYFKIKEKLCRGAVGTQDFEHKELNQFNLTGFSLLKIGLSSKTLLDSIRLLSCVNLKVK